MDGEPHDSDASVANANNGVVGAAKNHKSGDASVAISSTGVANEQMASPNGGTGQDVTAAIADTITHSLTIEDAQQRFARARRKVPSGRTIERYCADGKIRGIRQSVTYANGSHGKPWFLNEESLDAYIKQQPIVVLGDDGDANDQLATPNRELGVASGATVAAYEREVKSPASPDPQPAVIPVSEILLENARLQERLEGKSEIIKRIEDSHATQRQDWHSERDFLRTDVTETRALVREIRGVSDRILDTFKEIGKKQQEPDPTVQPHQIVYRPVQKEGNAGGDSQP
jgi:hypothetical protein